MLEEIHEGRNKMAHRVYIVALMCITMVILPFQQLRKFFDYHKFYNNFVDKLNKGTTNELDILNLYPLLLRNPFVGEWKSTVKRSEFLRQQQGKIQIKTFFNNSEYFNNYDINIKIFDGQFCDDRFYDITINSGSIKVEQISSPGKILYQTIYPLITHIQEGYGFKKQSEKGLYINKIKFKVFTQQKYKSTIKMQLLIQSQYSINIIGYNVIEYQQTFHDIFLALLLILQFLAQGYGLYKLSEGIISQKQCVTRYSRVGFLLSTSLDICEAVALSYLGFLSTKKMAIFSLPTILIWIIITVIELRILTILFQQQFNQNALRFSAKIYGIFCIVCVFCYFSNLHSFFFILISSIAMVPQIYNNYLVGHKLKQNMKYFLLYILPRYACIPYFRMYKYNIFGFKPNYSLILTCLVILAFQVILIVIQINYGVRSIVPKFLQPEELKYYFNQPYSQDDNCSICLNSLKQKGTMQNMQFNQMKAIRGEQFYNNIVLTPCRHKFHIQCLANSMKTKLQCPNCRTTLPPLDQYQ